MTDRVYVAVLGDEVKIGRSQSAEARAKSLGRDVKLVWQSAPYENANKIEALAHRLMALQAKPTRGEWFRGDASTAIEAVGTAVRQAFKEELALGGDFQRSGTSAPASSKGELVSLRITAKMRKQLEQIAASRMERPDKAVIIRELLAKALEGK